MACAIATNYVGSNLPGVKKYTYPFFGQMIGNYRVRHGVKGEFSRNNGGPDGKGILSYCYVIFNELDDMYYRVAFRNVSAYFQKVNENRFRPNENFSQFKIRVIF